MLLIHFIEAQLYNNSITAGQAGNGVDGVSEGSAGANGENGSSGLNNGSEASDFGFDSDGFDGIAAEVNF